MKWKFDFSDTIKEANKFIIKNDQKTTKKDIQLIFELVLTIKPQNSETEYQLSNGWGSIYFSELIKGDTRQKVWLKGGSPANLMEIDKDSVKAIATKKEFKLFGNQAQKDAEGFFITLDVKPVVSDAETNLSNDRIYYYALPKNFIFNQNLFGFVAGASLYVKWIESDDSFYSDIVLAQL